MNAKDALLGFLATSAIVYSARQIKFMASNIESLNVKIGQVLLHIQYHKEELMDHKERIKRLEDKV